MPTLSHDPVKFIDGKPVEGSKQLKQFKFLVRYAQCGQVIASARSAKISDNLHYYWLRTDKEYAERFKVAEARYVRMVEDTLHLVGVEGIDVPVLRNGKQVYINGRPYFEKKRSERILLAVAAARMPEKYGRQRVDLLDMDPANWTDAQVEAVLKRYLQNEVAAAGNQKPLELLAAEGLQLTESRTDPGHRRRLGGGAARGDYDNGARTTDDTTRSTCGDQDREGVEVKKGAMSGIRSFTSRTVSRTLLAVWCTASRAWVLNRNLIRRTGRAIEAR